MPHANLLQAVCYLVRYIASIHLLDLCSPQTCVFLTGFKGVNTNEGNGPEMSERQSTRGDMPRLLAQRIQRADWAPCATIGQILCFQMLQRVYRLAASVF